MGVHTELCGFHLILSLGWYTCSPHPGWRSLLDLRHPAVCIFRNYYWAALNRFQWLVLEAEVPGKVQLSTTSGFTVTSKANQNMGTSANS